MELTGSQMEQLSDALRSAFDYDRLERLLQYRLGKSLQDITLADSLAQIAFDVIQLAEAEGWTTSLVSCSRDAAPGNSRLLAFAQQLGLVSTVASRQSLEQTIRETNSFLDIDKWREALGRAEPCVCRVEVKVQRGTTYGTGFLVAPSLVMTNYHVAEAVIMGEQGKTTASGSSAASGDVVLRFDYKRSAEGDVVNPGVEYGLADEWLETSSPLSDADLKGGDAVLPAEDELDFVVLRLSKPAGDEPIGGRGEPGAVGRASDRAAVRGARLRPQESRLHPAASGSNAVEARARHGGGDLRQRERHARPVPNQHRAGFVGFAVLRPELEPGRASPQRRPQFDGIKQPEYNRGIPIAAIRSLIEARGLAGALGAQEP